MNKPVALSLGLLFLILLSSVLGGVWYLSSRTYDQPADVIAVADAIWPLNIPADMEPDFAINLFGAEGAHFGKVLPVKDMIWLARFPVAEETDAKVNWDFKLSDDWDAAKLTETASGTYQVPYQDEMLQAEFREGEDADGLVFRTIVLKREDGEGREVTVAWFGPAESATEARFAGMFQ
jgi:hypothetical protein